MNCIYFFPDVNTGTDQQQEQEDAWEREDSPDYVPTEFVRLISKGVDPETAADLADDGLPIGKPGRRGDLVVTWPMMYEETA